jgi:hypothetical protein
MALISCEYYQSAAGACSAFDCSGPKAIGAFPVESVRACFCDVRVWPGRKRFYFRLLKSLSAARGRKYYYYAWVYVGYARRWWAGGGGEGLLNPRSLSQVLSQKTSTPSDHLSFELRPSLESSSGTARAPTGFR